MIFVSVGTQLPFQRLISSVDSWAADRQCDVVFQTADDSFKPKSGVAEAFMSAGRYSSLVESCELFVSHAGMGSIITALMLGKPVVVLPRKASLGEHRNEHQIATCKRFSDLQGCYVAWDENELLRFLDGRSQLRAGSFHGLPAKEFAENIRTDLSQLF